MKVFYFTFHENDSYANYIQQVIANDDLEAKDKMNRTYPNKWRRLFTHREYEEQLLHDHFRQLKPLSPLY